MVGQGVVQECLKESGIESVLAVGRSKSGLQHPKFREIATDLFNYKAVETELSGYDACFFCLGTPSAGKSEEEYTRITYTLTLTAAETLARLNPQMTFIYVSGQGADSTEKGRLMWARIRGETENALFRLPFKAVYVFRPGLIQPLNGIKSKTPLYQVFYSALKPVLTPLRSLFPNFVSTTEQIGQAMIKVVRNGAPKKILDPKDFESVVRTP